MFRRDYVGSDFRCCDSEALEPSRTNRYMKAAKKGEGGKREEGRGMKEEKRKKELKAEKGFPKKEKKKRLNPSNYFNLPSYLHHT